MTPRGDAIGDVCIALMMSCPGLGSPDPEVVVGIYIEDVDLSSPENEVPFTITGVPDGTFLLGGVLDDDDSGCVDGGATSGDLVRLECPEVTITDGGDVTDIIYEFGFQIP